MKTFDEKDLITWANRDKAIIGNEYYFADIVEEMYDRIRDNNICTLIEILDNNVGGPFVQPLGNDYGFGCSSACILPVDAVKETEKKYRACKTIQEFCKLVTGNTAIQSNEQCSLYLVGCKLHLRNKENNEEVFSRILEIRKGSFYSNEYLHIIIGYNSSYTLEDCFECFEIELNGEWQPFGVLDDN